MKNERIVCFFLGNNNIRNEENLRGIFFKEKRRKKNIRKI